MSEFETHIKGDVRNLAQGDQASLVNLENIEQASPPQARVYLGKLSTELEALLAAMRKENSDDPAHALDIAAVTAAEKATIKGDPSAVVSFLTRTGVWAFEIATKIGTILAAEALKHATGVK